VSVFNQTPASIDRQLFLDPAGPVSIQRYDIVRYPIFLKLTKQQLSVFWLPDEINCTKDPKDFKALLPQEQHIVTSNIKRQIVLDSIQGRAPSQILGPIASVPEVEAFITQWTSFEQIHSMSYTHIIQAVYPNPSEVIDSICDNPLIMGMATDTSKYYDELDRINKTPRALSKDPEQQRYGHKRALWLCLHSINALEGIRFYCSFACTWAFAELGKMEGNASIIRLIARDENIHLAATQHMIKILARDDPDFARLKVECAPQVEKIFADVIQQEKEWAKYLFKDGSMIGLNYDLLAEYVEWIAHKRMINIGVQSPFKPGSNPLPWTQKWISPESVQPAPQEVSTTEYIQGVKKSSDRSFASSLEL
jgi:ribonucleoside-diphosphate reductase beta chain